MAKIQVRALQMCYIDHKRIREGGVFHTDGDKFMVKNSAGKMEMKLPAHLELVGKKAKVEAEPDEDKVVYSKSDEVI